MVGGPDGSLKQTKYVSLVGLHERGTAIVRAGAQQGRDLWGSLLAYGINGSRHHQLGMKNSTQELEILTLPQDVVESAEMFF